MCWFANLFFLLLVEASMIFVAPRFVWLFPCFLWPLLCFVCVCVLLCFCGYFFVVLCALF